MQNASVPLQQTHRFLHLENLLQRKAWSLNNQVVFKVLKSSRLENKLRKKDSNFCVLKTSFNRHDCHQLPVWKHCQTDDDQSGSLKLKLSLIFVHMDFLLTASQLKITYTVDNVIIKHCHKISKGVSKAQSISQVMCCTYKLAVVALSVELVPSHYAAYSGLVATFFKIISHWTPSTRNLREVGPCNLLFLSRCLLLQNRLRGLGALSQNSS